jgi:anti-sigma regulatory factor (Ser/Thr protein kinase)
MPEPFQRVLKITFPGEASELSAVRTRARDFLRGSKFDERQTAQLVMAIDEACSNIIRHVESVPDKPVRLEMKWMRDRLRCTLRDYGKPCDPEKIKGREWNDIKPGGLGVRIIRQVFDRVEYSPQMRGTRLTLEKRLPA